MQRPCLWSPSPEQKKESRIHQFMEAVNRKFSTCFQNYEDLYAWSVSSREDFWSFWAEYSGVPFFQSASTTISPAKGMESEKWFPDATLNYVQKIFEYKGDRPAIIAWKENGERQEVCYQELIEKVMAAHCSLRMMGIRKGDRIAGFMPNTVETVIMMLASASLGAIWSSCSPDFGVHTVLDRFGQIKPKLLICADGYQYAGKSISIMDKVARIISSIDSITHLVITPFLDRTVTTSVVPELPSCPEVFLWNDFLEAAKQESTRFFMEPLPFDHPLYILYSSGTTGAPKCMVHGHGGTLLQHLKEHQLHTDIREGDRVFYFTTCGWMMWNWLVSVLASGACAVLYDGSPFHPGPEKLWLMAEKERLSVFGTSAGYLAALAKAPYHPENYHKLSSLRTILSTGSPLTPESFDFVYAHIKSGVCLSSISGGTDIVSCFVLGCPILPVYRGEIQCRGLGMDVQFADSKGNLLQEEKGELVCRQGFPSRPVGFWNDRQNEKYHEAYFSRFKGWWAHGDYGQLTSGTGVILYGRSDTTLNPGGVRIGTAEIYRQVERVREVRESLAVGKQWQGDEQIVLFVIMQNGEVLTEELKRKIRDTLKNGASPRHVPSAIIQVADFPRTLSGKISETTVKNAINGQKVTNEHALANPETVDFFSRLTVCPDKKVSKKEKTP